METTWEIHGDNLGGTRLKLGRYMVLTWRGIWRKLGWYFEITGEELGDNVGVTWR